MVTISNARTLQGENGPFVVLDLDGDPAVRISQNTGKAYLTVSRTTILCTLKPEVAEKLIGKELPGRIKRVEVDPFSWVDKRRRGEDFKSPIPDLFRDYPSNNANSGYSTFLHTPGTSLLSTFLSVIILLMV